MTSIQFKPPQGDKWNRIDEHFWNEYNEEIVRQYRLGGKRGVARAHRWIQDQNIPGFQPTYVSIARLIDPYHCSQDTDTLITRRRAVEYRLMKWGQKTNFNATVNPISSIITVPAQMRIRTVTIQNQHNSKKFNNSSHLRAISSMQDIVKWSNVADSAAALYPTESSSDSSPSSNTKTSISSPSSNTNTSISSPSSNTKTSISSPPNNANTSDSTTSAFSSLGKRRGN